MTLINKALVSWTRVRHTALRRSASTAANTVTPEAFFVPKHDIPHDYDYKLSELVALFREKNVLVITGAGISTASGIPDYRGPNGSYSRGHKPMTHQEYMSSLSKRKRYWARNLEGYSFFSRAQPNDGHKCLAKLEGLGYTSHIITQNVDRLHQKAGAAKVTDLHGDNNTVVCMSCGSKTARAEFQDDLRSLNREWIEKNITEALQFSERLVRADGDAELEHVDFESFDVPVCSSCNGIMKPNVVMFGATVPLEKVDQCYLEVEKARSVLVAGSSLAVWSAFRFVKTAAQQKKPIAILNVGPTRADALATLNIQAPLVQTIVDLEGILSSPGQAITV